MTKKVDYYTAAGSPWAYFGHPRFSEITRRLGSKVNIKPVDFGRIFAATGGLPLHERPKQRQAYRLVELARYRDHLGMPLNLKPKFSPVPRDPAALLTIATDRTEGTEAAMRLSGALMRACWAEERDISDAATLAAICEEQGLKDSAALAARSKMPEIRALYEGYTDEAMALNVFGAPSYVIDGVIFWGQDRLEFVERALSSKA